MLHPYTGEIYSLFKDHNRENQDLLRGLRMSVNRRNFLYLLGAGAIASGIYPIQSTWASEPTSPMPSGEFTLPPLPYAYEALEPHIDTRTMQIHHGKHHAAYIKNLNGAIAKYPDLKGKSIETLLKTLSSLPEDIRTAVRNNGGGHANHSMFWQIMAPKAGGAPTGEIATAITQTFGNFTNFKQQFNEAGMKRFGSGWAWLVRTPAGKLQVMTTANQDSPLLEGFFPIMGNDLWEHAYYLLYQNRRADYLEAWWNVINWSEVNKRYAMAVKETQKPAAGVRG
jgi:superoxide dismutase, Fe-Mn family